LVALSSKRSDRGQLFENGVDEDLTYRLKCVHECTGIE